MGASTYIENSLKEDLVINRVNFEQPHPNKKEVTVKFFQDVSGILFVKFIFLRKKREGLVFRTKEIETANPLKQLIVIRLLVRSHNFDNDEFLLKIIRLKISSVIEGNNIESLAFGLFREISINDSSVKRPLSPMPIFFRKYFGYGLEVPVLCSRNTRIVTVRIRVIQSHEEQEKHKISKSKTPSIVIASSAYLRENYESKFRNGRRLLHEYVENNKHVMHV